LQSIRNQSSIVAQSKRDHCEIALQSKRDRFVIATKLLGNRFAIKARSLCNQSAIASQSKRDRFVIAKSFWAITVRLTINSPSIRYRVAIAARPIRNGFVGAAKLHGNPCAIAT
jgi:hypothetical protein